MYGCLDATTRIPSRRLTEAVLKECMVGMEESHSRVRAAADHFAGAGGISRETWSAVVVPFLRTAARTLRHSLDTENFLGCWGENEFLAVLPSASPVMVATTAESLWNLLSHSEVSWWGDRFWWAEASYTVASAGTDLESLLREMKPSHSSGTAKAAAAGRPTILDTSEDDVPCFRLLGSWWFSAAFWRAT
jgi:hypothetical protein